VEQTLGRYRIIKELGRGSMGRVLLAHDPQIDRQVAVKTVHIFSALPELEQKSARERFLIEVRAAGKLLHPGIVAIFDVGEEDGVPYLAMEYVEGQTLDAFCRPDTLLPPETAVELVASAAEALDYAHRADIVHRDIKPANILRVGEETMKIMDFGLAKGPHAHLTQEGDLLGTPSYMSPEQIRGETVDARSDLFSLAVVLYEMLTGVKPFKGETVSSVLFRIVNEHPRPASSAGRFVPAELSKFLEKALDKRPVGRFQSGAEFAAALREAGRAAAGAPRTAGADPPSPAVAKPVPVEKLPPPVVRRRRRSKMPYVIAAAMILVAVAVGVTRYREPLMELIGPWMPEPPAPAWLEAGVRTEPPGLPVLMDGEPLEAGVVRFPSAGPRGVLSATLDCRTAEHALALEDAGGEIVLVTDPVEVEVDVDPGVPGASVSLNGADAGEAPARVALDLCRENSIEVAADGYYPTSLVLPEGATPLEARTALGTITLEAIPIGRLMLPAPRTPVRFFVDGEAAESPPEGIELTAGEHVVRAVSKKYWIDVTTRVEVPANGDVTPEFRIPALAWLTVQAFPANCKVFLRRPRGRWVYLDTIPVRRKIAAGKYEVRVEFVPTGETRDRAVDLKAGAEEPIRFSFARPRQ
jgi:hypothetical protein